jgi:hypothetical protein
MLRRTYAYIVCSPHPRVGTTTAARLFADYLLHQRRNFEGFDTDPHEAPFATRFPQEVRITDLTAIQGQISLFDRLLVHDEVPKIVDVWNRSFKQFFSIAREVGFIEEARRLSIEPIVLFMIDDSNASLEAVIQMTTTWPDLSIVIVNNEGAAPLGENPHDILDLYPVERNFLIPPLDPIVQRAIDKPGFSLSRFMLAPPSDMSIVVRSALRVWLNRTFAQFNSFELRMAMSDTPFLS